MRLLGRLLGRFGGRVLGGLLALTLGILFAVFLCQPPAKISCESLQKCSALIITPESRGSGVFFRNGGHLYVWTAAHVVDSLIDRRGERPAFINAGVVQDVPCDEGNFAQIVGAARLVRYSESHDLALLKCYVDLPVRSAVFRVAPARPGQMVWHVGSPHGPRGLNSVSYGVVAAVGRSRLDGDRSSAPGSLVYDQVSIVAHRGCSGGGLFAEDGSCVGLLIEFLGPVETPGSLCIAPSRRILEFCRAARCEWAFSADHPVPAEDAEPIIRD